MTTWSQLLDQCLLIMFLCKYWSLLDNKATSHLLELFLCEHRLALQLCRWKESKVLTFISTSPRNWRSKYPNSSSTSLVAEDKWIFKAAEHNESTTNTEHCTLWRTAENGIVITTWDEQIHSVLSNIWNANGDKSVLFCPINAHNAEMSDAAGGASGCTLYRWLRRP